MKKLIAGNWKMNGTLDGAQELALAVLDAAGAGVKGCDLLVCPPFVHLETVGGILSGASVTMGAQDCAATENGAYTGDVSAVMLADIGCRAVILGHSERRQYHNESDEMIRAKVLKAHGAGLTAIVCVGETEAERKAGCERDVVASQLQGSLPDSARAGDTAIAYEPVWAIGTGKTATVEDVRVMHGFIRQMLQERFEDAKTMRILYGGSVKPDNAGALLAVENVDGALVGGASLKAGDFLAIAKAAC